jgi:hypothetical protein
VPANGQVCHIISVGHGQKHYYHGIARYSGTKELGPPDSNGHTPWLYKFIIGKEPGIAIATMRCIFPVMKPFALPNGPPFEIALDMVLQCATDALERNGEHIGTDDRGMMRCAIGIVQQHMIDNGWAGHGYTPDKIWAYECPSAPKAARNEPDKAPDGSPVTA